MLDAQKLHILGPADPHAPTINWQLSKYDLIIIDEISMIPDIIFKHIQKTLTVLLYRPVIMVC